MRRRVFAAAALVALVALAACRDDADHQLDALMPMLDAMCACRDKACGDAVATTYQAWWTAHAAEATGTLDQRHADRLQTIVGSMQTCRANAGGPDTLAP